MSYTFFVTELKTSHSTKRQSSYILESGTGVTNKHTQQLKNKK